MVSFNIFGPKFWSQFCLGTMVVFYKSLLLVGSNFQHQYILGQGGFRLNAGLEEHRLFGLVV